MIAQSFGAEWSEWTTRLTLTLAHSLWQGVLVGLIAFGVVAFLHTASSRARYAVCSMALLAMVALPVLTWSILSVESDARLKLTPTPAESNRSFRYLEGKGNPLSAVESSEPAPSPSPFVAAEPVADPRAGTLPASGPAIERHPPDIVTIALQPAEAISTASLIHSANMSLSHWSPWISGFWIIGVIALGSRFFGAWFAASRLSNVGIKSVGAPWQNRVDQLANRMGIRKAVSLLESSLVESPVVLGWLKPVVLVPIGMLSGLTSAQASAGDSRPRARSHPSIRLPHQPSAKMCGNGTLLPPSRLDVIAANSPGERTMLRRPRCRSVR